MALEHHAKIWSATSALHAWNTLKDSYNRTTLHNRVSMTRRRRGFKLEDGATMSKHLDCFDELVICLQTVNEPLDEA